MRKRLLAVTLFAALAASLPAFADGSAKIPVREYDSMWDPIPGSAQMWLAEDFASFSDLSGHLVLAYEGKMPVKGPSDPDVRIYRILNSEEFFKLNKGNNEYPCRKPAKWLGLTDRDAPGPLEEGNIRVEFYELADYRDYRDDKAGMCASYPYRLVRGG